MMMVAGTGNNPQENADVKNYRGRGAEVLQVLGVNQTVWTNIYMFQSWTWYFIGIVCDRSNQISGINVLFNFFYKCNSKMFNTHFVRPPVTGLRAWVWLEDSNVQIYSKVNHSIVALFFCLRLLEGAPPSPSLFHCRILGPHKFHCPCWKKRIDISLCHYHNASLMDIWLHLPACKLI